LLVWVHVQCSVWFINKIFRMYNIKTRLLHEIRYYKYTIYQENVAHNQLNRKNNFNIIGFVIFLKVCSFFEA